MAVRDLKQRSHLSKNVYLYLMITAFYRSKRIRKNAYVNARLFSTGNQSPRALSS